MRTTLLVVALFLFGGCIRAPIAEYRGICPASKPGHYYVTELVHHKTALGRKVLVPRIAEYRVTERGSFARVQTVNIEGKGE